MKKNLRIVSATAAALLAVAPVAAASVAPVFADSIGVSVNGDGTTTSSEAKLELVVTNAMNLVDGMAPKTATAAINKLSLPNGAEVRPSSADIYEVANGTNTIPTDAKPMTGNFGKGKTYIARVKVSIIGLNSYANKKIKVNNKDVDVNSQGVATDIILDSVPFVVSDPTLTGNPYVTDSSKKVLTSGSLDLTSDNLSVSKLADALTAVYKPAMTSNEENKTDSTTLAYAKFVDPKADVRTALKNAGITTKGTDETFDKPATSFVVTLNVVASNGQKTAFPVTVDPNATTADKTFPVISYNVNGAPATQFPNLDTTKGTVDKSASKTLDNIDDLTFGADVNAKIDFNYVPVNGVVDVNGIKKAFTAQVNTDNKDKLGVDVDISKVNTKVAGKYPVVVSATNADKKTTKITFMLTVGAKGATYKTVQANGDIPVYKIDGNTVTDTKTTVKNGDTIAVFGDAIKIGDKSYTRINSADSDLYVESQYVDGSFKPAPSVAKKVMHNSYIYDANHKRVGDKTLAAYTNINVYGDATKLADGSLVYKIGDNQFVMADNIDGTSRTLTHNAYVYKTSKKRADRRVLKKGTKVTTYGNPYKFKNGMSYYRIGGPAKQYVKVANF